MSNSQTRREFMKRTALASAALAAPALLIPGRAKAQTATLNVTTYENYLPKVFLDEFQKDTGIQVNLRLTGDQGKLYNLLIAEGASPTTDIVTVSGHRLPQFVGSNLLDAVDPDSMPEWNNLAEAYRDGPWLRINDKVWGLPVLAGFGCMARNSDYIDNGDSWEVLFDEKNKGVTSYTISDFLQIVMRLQGNDGDFVSYVGKPEEAQAAVNQARDFLILKKPWVRKYADSSTEMQQMYMNEDIYAGHTWSGPAGRLIRDGLPIVMSVPKEGAYGQVYTFGMVRNSPNTEAAKALLNAIAASPEVGATMSRQSGYASTFEKASALLTDAERASTTVPPDQLARVEILRGDNRAMLNDMVSRAEAEVKAA